MSQYTLIDAQKRNQENPRTFPVPSREILASVGRGSIVKIGVEFKKFGNITGERFWVYVTEIGAGTFKGKVNNDLVYTPMHGLKLNDMVSFDAKHILDVWPQRAR